MAEAPNIGSEVALFLKRTTVCRTWINKVLLDLDKDIQGAQSPFGPNELEFDKFYLALSDGVILCRVLRAISPLAIPKIHTNTRMSFKLAENVSFFIQACRDLGM